MIDEMFDRAYRDGRADLNGGIHAAFGGLAREDGAGRTRAGGEPGE